MLIFFGILLVSSASAFDEHDVHDLSDISQNPQNLLFSIVKPFGDFISKMTFLNFVPKTFDFVLDFMRNFNPMEVLEEPDDHDLDDVGRSYGSKVFALLRLSDFLSKYNVMDYMPKMVQEFFNFFGESYPLPDGLKHPYSEYDFVIVGAGSAGSVLASRLTEDTNTTVLLIESGKPEMFLTDVPAMAPFFQSTNYAWQYYPESQPGFCKGMINNRCFWPRGHAVGGSSVINYMMYTRGRPEEWDRIAASGNYGWSYDEVLKYFKRNERAKLDGYEHHPTRNPHGNTPVEFVPYRTKLVDAFLEAGRICGVPTIDYNSPDQLGFGYVQTITQRGRRQSAAKVFLRKQKSRRNLHVLPETRVTKVLIDSQTKTAYGVEYVRNKVKNIVRVRKEVILSAGPIASPQLLMLSGIGPKKHLQSLNIPVLEDLPVGKTLYDHITFTGLIYELNTTGVSLHESRILRLEPIVRWLINGHSPLSSIGGVEAVGYIKTPVSTDPLPVPDMELISIGGSILSDGGPGGSKAIRRGMRIRDEVIDEAFGKLDRHRRDTWSAYPLLLKPISSGYLELKSKNPFTHPRIYANYLSHPKDIATFISAMRYIQTLAETEPFQRFGARLHEASYPTCRGKKFDSDEYWECAVRTLTSTLYHQTSTSRMGPKDDPLAVVDPELRVYGIEHLRVVDSGVIPYTISAHTHAPAMMIGEKASDMIKAAWGIHYNAHSDFHSHNHYE